MAEDYSGRQEGMSVLVGTFPIIILTGLSGAGKSSVLNVFEDMRYFTIDGLPLEVASSIMPLLSPESLAHYRGLVLGVDLRQHFEHDFSKTLLELRSRDKNVRLLFVEADTAAIMRRYAATRRPHPLEVEGLGLEKAAITERERLLPLRNLADQVIDSTDYSIHDLRRVIQQCCAQLMDKTRNFRVHIISFGFKYGLPAETDMMFDLRFLPNPFFVDELRPLSGLESLIADYVLNTELGQVFMRRMLDFFRYLLPLYEKEGRYRLTIAFGCTGGRHRSVAVAEAVGEVLRGMYYAVTTEHRHLALS